MVRDKFFLAGLGLSLGLGLSISACHEDGRHEPCSGEGCTANTEPSEETRSGVHISPMSFSVSEVMQSTRLTLRLLSQPAESVTVELVITENEDEIRLERTHITFMPDHWDEAAHVTIQGVDDGLRDGDQTVIIEARITSLDPVFSSLPPMRLSGQCIDDGAIHTQEPEPQDPLPPNVLPEHTVRLRMMAANITSGKNQAYQNEGIRIFQALKPDIVMIQEFNYDGGQQGLVNKAFGGFYWASSMPDDSNSPIPNGIISRYEILDSGSWRGTHTASNRNYDWALIDLPGSVDLLAVSVHLLTDQAKHRAEMPELVGFIENKLNALRSANPAVTYAAVIGGDFNVSQKEGRSYTKTQFSPLFEVKNSTDAAYPVDQNGNDLTSGERDDPYDWLLVTPNLDRCETPVRIGKHVYPNGHVFDSRVYGNYTESKTGIQWGCLTHQYVDELQDLPSIVKVGDSGATNMQHMPVIRDFIYTTAEQPDSGNTYCHFK